MHANDTFVQRCSSNALLVSSDSAQSNESANSASQATKGKANYTLHKLQRRGGLKKNKAGRVGYGRGQGRWGVGGEQGPGVPVGAMEPTAKPMEEAVKDSRHVIPMNRTNLHHIDTRDV